MAFLPHSCTFYGRRWKDSPVHGSVNVASAGGWPSRKIGDKLDTGESALLCAFTVVYIS